MGKIPCRCRGSLTQIKGSHELRVVRLTAALIHAPGQQVLIRCDDSFPWRTCPAEFSCGLVPPDDRAKRCLDITPGLSGGHSNLIPFDLSQCWRLSSSHNDKT